MVGSSACRGRIQAWGFELALGSAALALVGGLVAAADETAPALVTAAWTSRQSRPRPRI
jgi:hypothetical protein